MRCRYKLVALGIQLLQVAAGRRRIIARPMPLLLLHLAASRNKLPACRNILRHAVQRHSTKGFAVALCLFCSSSGASVVVWVQWRGRCEQRCCRAHTDLPALSACSCNSAAAVSKAALKTSMCCNGMSNVRASKANRAAQRCGCTPAARAERRIQKAALQQPAVRRWTS